MTQKHTPTPWTQQGEVITKDGATIAKAWLNGLYEDAGAHDLQQDNARFIVRACNAHDELVAALEEIRQGCIARRPGHCDAHMNRTKAEIEAIAERALAKARGEAA